MSRILEEYETLRLALLESTRPFVRIREMPTASTNMYRLPKDKVEEFNCAELLLSMNLDDLSPYKESPK